MPDLQLLWTLFKNLIKQTWLGDWHEVFDTWCWICFTLATKHTRVQDTNVKTTPQNTKGKL